MKKIFVTLTALLAVTAASAFPKAFYVKKGDNVTKYNFGVAENLHFSDNGRTLTVDGYADVINLDEIDYISFSAPVSASLTPAQQKEKLLAIGTEASSMVSAYDQQELIRMMSAYADGYYDDQDSWHEPPCDYDVPREYVDVHNELGGVMKALKALAKGDPSAVRSLRNKTVNLYKIEDYNGIYTADEQTRSWVKTPADYFGLRFKGLAGEDYSVRMDAGAEYTVWNTSDFNGRFPRVIDIRLCKGTAVLATCRIETSLVQDQSIDQTVTFESNGYVVKSVMKAVDDGINDVVTVTIGGQQLCRVDSDVKGKNLMNYDEMRDAIEAMHPHDEDGNCIDGDHSRLMTHLYRFTSTVDVLGKLEVDSRVSGASRFFELSEYESDDDCIDIDGFRVWTAGKILSRQGNTFDITYDDTDRINKQIATLNDYADVSFRYAGDAVPQGYLCWETAEETSPGWISDESDYYGYVVFGDYLINVYRTVKDAIWNEDRQDYDYVYTPWSYSGYNEELGESRDFEVKDSEVIHPTSIVEHYYDKMPLLVFSDLTSYALKDFFDTVSFGNLVDDYNDIIDAYYTITGRSRSEEQ